MKKLIMGLFALIAMSSFAMADEIVGYDGDCAIYFRPGYGYFEVCENTAPVFLGVEFGGIMFRHGGYFRNREEFHRHGDLHRHYEVHRHYR